MDLNEAKELIKNEFTNADFNLIDEKAKELSFQLPNSDTTLLISESDINEYIQFELLKPSFGQTSLECCICNEDYREHILEKVNPRPIPLFQQSETFQFINTDINSIRVEIGLASKLFFHIFQFKESMLQYTLKRKRFYLRRQEQISLEDLQPPILTIKVFNINKNSVDEAIKSSSQIIDNCLFELSYINDIVLRLQENWQLTNKTHEQFNFDNHEHLTSFPLPKCNFISDIIRFYQRAVGTDDPVDQFLAFYHVLEYFFVNVSNEHLYNKLKTRIDDPKFKTTDKYLDQIIKDTLHHKQLTDETEMLKLVLNKYIFDKDELIEFIQKYEDFIGEKLYTENQLIYGEKIKIQLEQNHIMGLLAKRIKVIRNALVHSSDRFERQQRYIPTINAEKKLRKEIPLLKYLAEKVIVGSSE